MLVDTSTLVIDNTCDISTTKLGAFFLIVAPPWLHQVPLWPCHLPGVLVVLARARHPGILASRVLRSLDIQSRYSVDIK